MRPDGPLASERPSRWVGWGMLTGEPARCDFTQTPRKGRKVDFPQRRKLKDLRQAWHTNGCRVSAVLPVMPRVERAEIEGDFTQRKEEYWLLRGARVTKEKKKPLPLDYLFSLAELAPGNRMLA